MAENWEEYREPTSSSITAMQIAKAGAWLSLAVPILLTESIPHRKCFNFKSGDGRGAQRRLAA
jgi:hypothetical protein